MNGLTAEQLITAASVLLTLFGAVSVADRFADTVKKWRAPEREVKSRLSENSRTLEAHEEAIRSLREGQKVLCAGVVALLDHELHNGGSRRMARARDELSAYLSGRIGKPS